MPFIGKRQLVSQIGVDDPPFAWTWAQSIASDRERARSMERIFRSWQRYDPEAAQSAVEAADLSDDALLRIQRQMIAP